MKKISIIVSAILICLLLVLTAFAKPIETPAAEPTSEDAVIDVIADEPTGEETKEETPRVFVSTKAKASAEKISKEVIFNRMLSSVDYFDIVYEKIVYFMPLINEEIEIEISSDLRNGKSYQLYKSSTQSIENFSNGVGINRYDNDTKTAMGTDYIIPYVSTEDELKEKAENRVYSDGMGKHYVLRSNPTGAGLASISLLPQETTFGLLEDFSKWELADEIKYLERDCILIRGKTDDSYYAKTKINSFELTVDKNTGIILKLEGFDEENKLTNYTYVTEFSIDSIETEDILASKLDIENTYTEYTKVGLF